MSDRSRSTAKRLRLVARCLSTLVPLVPLFALGADSASPPAPRSAAPFLGLAAASLTDVLPKVAAAWSARGGAAVSFSFESSSRLARRAAAGAPGDLFFSADAEWMDDLQARSLLVAATRVDLLGNDLVVVTPAARASVIRAPGDLARPEVAHVALAGESVPAGKYARAALRSLGVWEAVKGRVVTGDDVRTTLAWVARGEADAGLVFATDARVEPRVRVALTLPPSSHPPIVYPAAVLASSAHREEAARFLAFCQSAEARALFEQAGFKPLAPPR